MVFRFGGHFCDVEEGYVCKEEEVWKKSVVHGRRRSCLIMRRRDGASLMRGPIYCRLSVENPKDLDRIFHEV